MLRRIGSITSTKERYWLMRGIHMGLQFGVRVLDFSRRLGDQLYSVEGTDKRHETRARVLVPLLVTEVDEDGRARAAPFGVMSRDVSSDGLGLISTQEVTSDFLRVVAQTPDDGEWLVCVVRVSRCRPIGLFFDIGGEILAAEESWGDVSTFVAR